MKIYDKGAGIEREVEFLWDPDQSNPNTVIKLAAGLTDGARKGKLPKKIVKILVEWLASTAWDPINEVYYEPAIAFSCLAELNGDQIIEIVLDLCAQARLLSEYAGWKV